MEFYNLRGGQERIFDEMNNGFGWNRLPQILHGCTLFSSEPDLHPQRPVAGIMDIVIVVYTDLEDSRNIRRRRKQPKTVVFQKTTKNGCSIRKNNLPLQPPKRRQMAIRGIITGDIIKSGDIPTEQRGGLLDTIHQLSEELQILSPLKMELFRGDGFQIAVHKPEEALTIAVLLRAGLKSRTPEDSHRTWDARVSLGVGDTGFETDKLSVSDGEAFRLSGRELDEIGKRKLTVKTKWEDINGELNVSTAFADDIISGWSSPQAQAIYISLLYRKSQKEIAAQVHKTAQNVSKLLAAAKETLIQDYVNRYHDLITAKTQE